MPGSQDFAADPRNANLKVWLNGKLVPKDQASVSIFDAGFVLGDGVWEGIRVHNGRMAFLKEHLDRLWEGAKAIAMDIGISREEMVRRLYETIDANKMDACHIRLMVTRGVRSTPYQDPRVVVSPATIVIIAEHKEPHVEVIEKGITLFTVDCTLPGFTRGRNFCGICLYKKCSIVGAAMGDIFFREVNRAFILIDKGGDTRAAGERLEPQRDAPRAHVHGPARRRRAAAAGGLLVRGLRRDTGRGAAAR